MRWLCGEKEEDSRVTEGFWPEQLEGQSCLLVLFIQSVGRHVIIKRILHTSARPSAGASTIREIGMSLLGWSLHF